MIIGVLFYFWTVPWSAMMLFIASPTRVLLNTYPCADSSLMHVEIAFEEVRFETLFIFTGWSHCSYFPVKK